MQDGASLPETPPVKIIRSETNFRNRWSARRGFFSKLRANGRQFSLFRPSSLGWNEQWWNNGKGGSGEGQPKEIWRPRISWLFSGDRQRVSERRSEREREWERENHPFTPLVSLVSSLRPFHFLYIIFSFSSAFSTRWPRTRTRALFDEHRTCPFLRADSLSLSILIDFCDNLNLENLVIFFLFFFFFFENLDVFDRNFLVITEGNVIVLIVVHSEFLLPRMICHDFEDSLILIRKWPFTSFGCDDDFSQYNNYVVTTVIINI